MTTTIHAIKIRKRSSNSRIWMSLHRTYTYTYDMHGFRTFFQRGGGGCGFRGSLIHLGVCQWEGRWLGVRCLYSVNLQCELNKFEFQGGGGALQIRARFASPACVEHSFNLVIGRYSKTRCSDSERVVDRSCWTVTPTSNRWTVNPRVFRVAKVLQVSWPLLIQNTDCRVALWIYFAF